MVHDHQIKYRLMSKREVMRSFELELYLLINLRNAKFIICLPFNNLSLNDPISLKFVGISLNKFSLNNCVS